MYSKYKFGRVKKYWVRNVKKQEKGGRVIAKGTPNEIAENSKSITGKYLKEYL